MTRQILSRPRRSGAALWAVVSALALAGCNPSATVKQKSPIANLQTYRNVAVRVGASPEGSAWTGALETAVVASVSRSCRFDYVGPTNQQQSPDLIVDLNIQRSYRGGTGFLQNANQAVMDVLLVLSDGATDDLLGSAWIQGESPTMHVEGTSPEGKAIDAVADSVAKVLNMSGCALARVDPEPAPEPEPEPTATADDSVQRAEALNDEGKTLFRAADVKGAIYKFRAAIDLVPDPRYYFNLCFSYEALKQYDAALSACQQVLDANPNEQLRSKTEARMSGIRGKQGG